VRPCNGQQASNANGGALRSCPSQGDGRPSIRPSRALDGRAPRRLRATRPFVACHDTRARRPSRWHESRGRTSLGSMLNYYPLIALGGVSTSPDPQLMHCSHSSCPSSCTKGRLRWLGAGSHAISQPAARARIGLCSLSYAARRSARIHEFTSQVI